MRAQDKLEVRISCSTSVFGVSDFKRVLRPGKVFSSFSRESLDCQRSCLYNQDVLIDRYLMHRRSDVQKVRAVYSDQLTYIQNVIVFSTRGSYSLVEKMSNGDYDDDRFWICWEPRLIEEFKNAPPPIKTPPEKLEIRVESETFLQSLRVGGIDRFLSWAKASNSTSQNNVLSKCANFPES
jgi:hypothetical protein